MYKFLIQTKGNEIIHDFAFHLKEAIKYNNWFYNEHKFNHVYTEDINSVHLYDIEEYIPVGSIEFVLDFYKTYHGISNIKPINIPTELKEFKYLKRQVSTTDDLSSLKLLPEEKVFVKSIDKFKDYTDIVKVKDIPRDKNLLASSLIEISSEWRVFVFNGKILDIKNYSGYFKCFPNIETIEAMVADYKTAPKAYTLDIATIDRNENDPPLNSRRYGNTTVLIEVHQFFSCGLYGFNDYEALPKMFISTHKEMLKLKNN